MESLPKPGHHAVMCAFLVFVPTKNALLVVEENGVLVEREVVANLFLEGGFVKVLPRAKISADGMFNSGHPRWTNQPWQASQYLCQETGLQGRGRNVPSG